MNGNDEASNITRRSALGVIAVSAVSAGTIGVSALAKDIASLPPTQVVQTSLGPVRGSIKNGIQTFKGLRYGAPTGGANRFMPPKKPEPWQAVQDAIHFGDSAP